MVRTKELETIPEQELGYPKAPYVWSVSREFMQLIDRMPSYYGVLLEDGKTVKLAYAEGLDHEPDIPLEAYLKGGIYATLLSKRGNLYIPQGLRSEVKGKSKKAVKAILEEMETESCLMQEYSGTSGECMNELWRRDSER